MSELISVDADEVEQTRRRLVRGADELSACASLAVTVAGVPESEAFDASLRAWESTALALAQAGAVQLETAGGNVQATASELLELDAGYAAEIAQWDVWRAVAAEPGWTGVSATAAQAQFTHFGTITRGNADLLPQAWSVVEHANTALARARDDFRALPPIDIAQDLIARVASGAGAVITGFGAIAAAADLLAYARMLSARRREAARAGVERFEGWSSGRAGR